ncbi:hypothetical protein GCM10020367_11690 [Streptomyces sannanensis]|uniref:HEAT repeat domain-containing protein n=1 Tax=Streptomyces sannanensis TaxID=285536 RepID=A0ABP6S6S8_9ACTN
MSTERGDGMAAARALMNGEPLHTVLDTSDPAAWTALDFGVREPAWYEQEREPLDTRDSIRRRRLSLDGHALLPTGSLARTRGLALALCHDDGRTRERALGAAAGVRELLPLVVIRCTDWAEPVRERARAVLREALPGAPAEDLPLLTALVLRLAVRARGDFARGLLDEVLRSAPYETVHALLGSGDRATRRFAHRIAVDKRMFSPVELARIAASADDVVVQDMCGQAAFAAVGDEGQDEVLVPLLSARNPRVRSWGVTALRRAGRHAQAEPYLADRSAVVRACARWVVRQDGADPVAVYRAWCTGDDMPPHAPLGLAECGVRADAALLWPLVAHPVAGVRAGAVAGLRALDTADAERLRPLLDDPAPAVVREAAASLEASARQLPEAWLVERLATDRPPHVRAAAFRLLWARGGTAGPAAARQLADDPDPKLSARARQALRRSGAVR